MTKVKDQFLELLSEPASEWQKISMRGLPPGVVRRMNQIQTLRSDLDKRKMTREHALIYIVALCLCGIELDAHIETLKSELQQRQEKALAGI